MAIPFEFFIKFCLCSMRILLVLLVDFVDSVDCLLILSSHFHLIQFSVFFPLSFFFIEILKFFSQLISLLFLIHAMPSLSSLETLICFGQMLVVLISLLFFLLEDLDLILLYFFDCRLNFLFIVCSSHLIFRFLLTIQVLLVLRSLNGKIDIVPLNLIARSIQSAVCLTDIDFDFV